MNVRRVRRVAAALIAAAAAGCGCSTTPTPSEGDAKGGQIDVSPKGARATDAPPQNPDPQIR